jgi:hypothetical protein
MDPRLTPISTSLIPKADYHVRRRKYLDGPWLIANSRFYQLDTLTDHLWVACDGNATIEEIAKGLSATENLTLGEALAATLLILEYFRELGFISYVDEA